MKAERCFSVIGFFHTHTRVHTHTHAHIHDDSPSIATHTHSHVRQEKKNFYGRIEEDQQYKLYDAEN